MAEVNSAGSSSVSRVRKVNMLNFIANRGINSREADFRILTKNLFDSAKDLYKKNLIAHYGCVNAIEFSGNGNLLFSGGDDRRVLMWNVNNAMMYYTGKLGDGAKPFIMRSCHYSNIFCLAVDDANKRVLSGSNDDQVLVHDYSTGTLLDIFMHDSPVFSLSLHPDNGNVFASAVDKGKILVYDIRKSSADPLCLAMLRTPFHGVMFNPCEPSLIATANSKAGVHLWDLRKPKEILCECTDAQSMAVRWNQSGTILLALRNLLPPIIYNPLFPKKSLEFDSDCYYNACTMKSCSFAGDNDEYVMSGSDDFNLYMWKIPDPWPESKWVANAHLALTGHRSIVNQVRYNASKQLIATSGVEKVIKIWSPFRMPYSEGDLDKPSLNRPRVLCSSRSCFKSPGLLSHDYSEESVDEDTRMIHFFDSLLRNELHESTPLSLSHSCCVDGKLYPVSKRKKDSRPYEKLIIKKKKHLSKILTEKSDDDRPMCSLHESSDKSLRRNARSDLSFAVVASSPDSAVARSHTVLRLSQRSLSESTENSGNARGTLNDLANAAVLSASEDEGSSNDLQTKKVISSPTSASPVDEDENSSPSSSSSSSSASSSTITSNGNIDSAINSPFDGDSHVSSDQTASENVNTSSDNSYHCGASSKKYCLSSSDSDDLDKRLTAKAKLGNFKDSGINLTESSDSESANSSSIFKRKRMNTNRCYRRSTRKHESSGSASNSDGESGSKKPRPSNETKSKDCP